jgi:hypothetical protein
VERTATRATRSIYGRTRPKSPDGNESNGIESRRARSRRGNLQLHADIMRTYSYGPRICSASASPELVLPAVRSSELGHGLYAGDTFCLSYPTRDATVCVPSSSPLLDQFGAICNSSLFWARFSVLDWRRARKSQEKPRQQEEFHENNPSTASLRAAVLFFRRGQCQLLTPFRTLAVLVQIYTIIIRNDIFDASVGR